jgi:hypothetical protein
VFLRILLPPSSVSRSKSSKKPAISRHLGSEILTVVVMKSTIIWDIMPCSLLKVTRHFGGTYRLHPQGRRISPVRNQHESRWQAELVSCSAHCSTLKMEAICSSETPVDFQRTTQHYIPEDSTLQDIESSATHFAQQ